MLIWQILIWPLGVTKNYKNLSILLSFFCVIQLRSQKLTIDKIFSSQIGYEKLVKFNQSKIVIAFEKTILSI